MQSHEAFGLFPLLTSGDGTEADSAEDRDWGGLRDDRRSATPRLPVAADEAERAGARPPGIVFVIEPARVLRFLLFIIAGLVILSTATQAMRLYVPHFPSRNLIARLFYVDFEQSVPTLYSSAVLLIAASLFGVIGHAHRRLGRRYARHWKGLSVLFVLLAIDEFAVLHEQATGPFRRFLSIESGPLWWAWVIPAAVAVAVLALSLLPFFQHLPWPTRRRLLAAGVLFIAGAIGVEMVGAAYASVNGILDFTYVLITTAEETLEMLGAAILVYALLAYVSAELPDTSWRLRVAALD